MDPISIILSALASGAAKPAGDMAQDAYNGLKTLIKRKFESQGKPASATILDMHEQKPELAKPLLKSELKEAGADKDEAILKQAQDLLYKIKQQPGGQEIITQTQTNTASGNTVSGNFTFAPHQESKKG
jgi:hypothetical protein